MMKAYGDSIPVAAALSVQLLDWTPSRQPYGRWRTLPSVETGINNERTSPTSSPLQILLTQYRIPPAVLTERKQSVTHSFGHSKLDNDDIEIAWYHFLSKDLAVREDVGGEFRVLENGIANDRSSQANSLWIMSDYFIHIQRSPSPNSKGSRFTVTLLCFGAPEAVVERFRRSLDRPLWEDVCQEPYLLFDFIYEELYQLVDDRAWMLADVFRTVERSTLESAQDTKSKTANVDFAGLHNASKHCTFLLEAVSAASKTLDAMAEHLETAAKSMAHPETTTWTATLLRYRKRNFQSTHLRLESPEKRMGNIISLSVHLVSQVNNQVLRDDSRVMKTIAVMTLIFLPAMGVASVLSSPFFAVDFQKDSGLLQVSTALWILWLLALLLTACVLLLWWWWYRASKRGSRLAAKLSTRWLV